MKEYEGMSTVWNTVSEVELLCVVMKQLMKLLHNAMISPKKS